MRYAPYFCEENIWHACQDASLCDAPSARRFAVLISNPTRTVAMWHQRAAQRPASPVVWDYHVVLALAPASASNSVPSDEPGVIDLDTTLCTPGAALPLSQWLSASFRSDDPALAPLFRVIPAADYVAQLASDRSHMLDDDGQPTVPFPPWPPIGKGMNLFSLIDMLDVDGPGVVVDRHELAGALAPGGHHTSSEEQQR